MKKQLILIGIITLLICIGLSGCNEISNIDNVNNNPEDNNSERTPDIAFNKQVYPPQLIVVRADAGLKWLDFNITGECNDSLLGENVIAGDIITDCSGTITIIHNPTNTLIGIWTFE